MSKFKTGSMSTTNRFLKRVFDLCVAIVGLTFFSPIIILCWIIAAVETRSNGFFIHERIGRYGAVIKVYKIKTMYVSHCMSSSIASKNKFRITKFGSVLRSWKLDELPQLFNVLIGDMSIVGPRPDVPGYADRLNDEDRVILLLRPGITGPASIKYRNEEEILAASDDAVLYNDMVIWPDKVMINKNYIINYSFLRDIQYALETIIH
jgi:lipopolysaccharide/colanic/teichoic acid biosynthesis glycosyltransferase